MDYDLSWFPDLAGKKSFGQAAVQIAIGFGQMWVRKLTEIAIQKIAVDQANVVGTAAGAAPHPFLIPVFVALGLAALAAGLSSVGWSNNNEGGGGGGGSTIPDAVSGLGGLGASGQDFELSADRLAQTSPDFVDRVSDDGTGDGGRFGGFEIRVTDANVGAVMDLMVRATEDGNGSTTNRLLTAGDIGGLVPANG